MGISARLEEEIKKSQEEQEEEDVVVIMLSFYRLFKNGLFSNLFPQPLLLHIS